MHARTWARGVAFAAVLATATVGQAPAQRVSSVTVNLRAVEIDQAAQQIGRITGRTFVLDPAVRGQITVVSSRPVGPGEAFELFRTALRANGFAAVRSGNVYRIVPVQAAVQGGSRPDSRAAGRNEIVTRVVRLGNLPAADAQRAIRPLASQAGSVEATTRPNAVVITDYAENVRRLEALARQLDGGAGGGAGAAPSFSPIVLRNGNAQAVAEAIRRLLGDEASGGPRVAVDPRSNTVIIRGSRAQILEARRVAAALDGRSNAQLTTRVFRLRFSDAESVTEVLRGILGGGAQASNPVARSLGENAAGSTFGAGSTSLFDQGGSNATTGNAEALAGALASRGFGSVAPGSNAPAATTPAAVGFSTPDLAIQPSTDLNAVVVRGSPAAIETVAGLIQELDLRRPQVTIDVAIVEITGEAAERLGVQIGLGAAAQLPTGGGTNFTNVGLSLAQILGAIGSPAGAGAAAAIAGGGLSLNIGDRGDFGVLLQALATSTQANLLSNPTLTTLDNKPAEIVVGQNVPFRTGAFTTDGNSTNPFTTIEREDVGITLRVVPRIHEGDVVRLEVSQEVSSIANTTVSGAADLITNRRAIKTTVFADDQRTVVLGGLISDDRLSGRSKVPILGDIPLLGELFKSRTVARSKRVLFLFLRPTILRDAASAAAETRRRYDRIRGEEYPGEDIDDLLQDAPGPRLPVDVEGIY